MTISENVGLLKAIFKSPKVVPDVSRLKLFSIAKQYGLSYLYVGNRVNHYVDFPPMCNGEEHKERSGKTLFFHDKDDRYYYDILDENTRCIIQKEGFTVANHVCTDVESLSECLNQKVKKIGGIK